MPEVGLMKKLLEEVKTASTLPQVLTEVMEVTADPKAGAEDLYLVMRNDPPLTAKVLNVVNSSYYALEEEMSDLKRAVAYLGFKVVRNIALTASVCDLFKEKAGEGISGYSRLALWKHCVATAFCARFVAHKRHFGHAEDLYAAGLLHDIGVILEDQYVHESFAEIVQQPTVKRMGLAPLERRKLGFDHAKLGAQVAKQWKLPQLMVESIASHHDLKHAVHYRTEAAYVCVANDICHELGYSFLPEMPVDEKMKNAALRLIGFTAADCEKLKEGELAECLQSATELF